MTKKKGDHAINPLIFYESYKNQWNVRNYANEIKILFRTTKTAIQYFPYTRNLSVCNVCGTTTGGLHEKCKKCGAENLQWMAKEYWKLFHRNNFLIILKNTQNLSAAYGV
ncbi:MAG: hypothetical protein COV98_03170 [Candidatus Altarchaeum sp. CG12_big_fil_rev_8_21_14_0_65_33_22]|nr:MAG: hypothetical protein AUK59_04010 [Candidatus Altarchaeum sp. CG2_30_32_3053]PIN67381.1 MAG: hypothetical protein COV98_03170 [Candidatus Altarchaeum sp. CG12_big_fil_rev_8_21_14_0_65_33_22]PIV28144.1 MAG: hypothetical protein COS36_03220 [Candidatus Altarchaeum sp. CG03_land_8_20_14_0_80_32_618]PIZ31975.1 MAG: hypothetical protein COY41_01795 [Candidatus Altarchaeum sp. CG_4_10_14_0_8_um_filter_32_851]